MKELTIPATVENIEKVTEFVNSQLEEINCPIKAKIPDGKRRKDLLQYRSQRLFQRQ